MKYRTIYRNNLNDGKLDYSVTDAMIAGGLYDAFHEFNKSFKHTAPIKSNFTKNSTPRRIDYIWINKALLPKISSIDIVQNQYTENISDHYPLLMQIK